MTNPANPHLKQRFVTGAATMGVARILEQMAVFARNLIIANLLGAQNQGIAATFAISLSFLEMLSDFSAGRLIIQADDGEDKGLQASLHSWNIARGIVLGALLFAAAGPIAGFFQVSSADWAFRLLAVVPVIKGFEHLDLRRFQRNMKFGRFAASSLVPQFLTAALAWPLAKSLGDYSAALYLVILQVAATVLASHLLAERPYRVGLKREHVRRLLAFGLPLILNGGVLFAVLQGDRAIIGRFYTPADLGVYSVASGLALMAANLLMSVVSPLALPALAGVRSDPERYQAVLAKMMEIALICAVPIATAFIVLGPVVLRLIYSADYRPAESYIGILGLAAALRMLRVVPNSAQMAHGDNMALFHASASRITGTAMALFAAMNQSPLALIAWCGVAGEIVALATTAGLLKARQNVRLGSLASALGLVILFFACGWGVTMLPIHAAADWLNFLTGAGFCAVLMALLVVARPSLRGEAAVTIPRLLRSIHPSSKRTRFSHES